MVKELSLGMSNGFAYLCDLSIVGHSRGHALLLSDRLLNLSIAASFRLTDSRISFHLGRSGHSQASQISLEGRNRIKISLH